MQDGAKADRRERRPQTRPTTRATVSVEEKAQSLVEQTDFGELNGKNFVDKAKTQPETKMDEGHVDNAR